MSILSSGISGSAGNTVLQSYTGATKPSYGKLQLRCEKIPQYVPMPANRQFNFEVSQTLPDGIDLIIGRPKLFSTGLLRAVVLSESQTPAAFAQNLREETLVEDADFWEIYGPQTKILDGRTNIRERIFKALFK